MQEIKKIIDEIMVQAYKAERQGKAIQVDRLEALAELLEGYDIYSDQWVSDMIKEVTE